MSQMLPVNDLKWVNETFPVNNNFIKSSHEESYKGYFLVVNVQYPENFIIFAIIHPFFLKNENQKS